MKIYFHINTETFANSYLIVNEASKEALIIDPCKITNVILNQIESAPYELKAVLFTNTQVQKTHALSTLLKIYRPTIYAADFSVSQKRDMLNGSGIIEECGFKIEYSSFQWHSFDAVIYRLSNLLLPVMFLAPHSSAKQTAPTHSKI
ncbi:MAG: hypothetical protein Ta2A_25560 [Treponemataceae bacterium]|nr:MAG: hypothetical protein Ta2A_25560 [Treponemataceae bacterium]